MLVLLSTPLMSPRCRPRDAGCVPTCRNLCCETHLADDTSALRLTLPCSPPSQAWSRSWEVVRGQCDADGWQYAAGWPKGGAQWAATPTLSHVVRRRRWRRARVWTGTLCVFLITVPRVHVCCGVIVVCVFSHPTRRRQQALCIENRQQNRLSPQWLHSQLGRAEMEQWEATCAPPQPRVETEVSESTSSVVASPSAATLEKEMQQIERETAAMLRETEIESPLEETLQLSDNGDDEVELSMEEIERETAAILRETTENHPDSPLPPDGGVVSLEQLLADPLGTAAGPCSSEPDVGVMRLLDQPRVASDEEHAHAAAASGGPTAAAGLRQLLFGRVGDKANLTTTSDADTVQRKERTADDVRAKYGRPRQSELVEAAAEASERLAERGERIANLMHVSERMERDAQTMAIAAKKLAHNQKGWFGI
jgi:hypothetical protein